MDRNKLIKGLGIIILLLSFCSLAQAQQGSSTNGQCVLAGVNTQTGAGYTIVNGDRGKLISLSNASAQTVTLPSPAPVRWCVFIENYGNGTWTISRNGLLIDTAASNVNLTTGQGIVIVSDGTNYYTMRGLNGGLTSTGSGLIMDTSSAVALGSTVYVPLSGGGVSSGTEASADIDAPQTATISNLFVQLSSAVGAGNSVTITLRDAGASVGTPSNLSCVISGASATSCNDVTNSFTATKGDLLDWQITVSGAIVATPNFLIAAQWGGSISTGSVGSGTNGDVANYNGTGTTVGDAGFLSSNVVRKDAANTGAAAMTMNMSASTTANALRAPAQAGLTAGADGAVAYDTTAKITHIRTNAADSLAMATTGTSTTTTQVPHATAVAGVYNVSAIVDADIPAAITRTIANGTSALGTGAISSATCATVVTTSATGTATTDNIMADFNADPHAVTGYIPSTSGMLTIIKYPTANNVNFLVCNNTSGSITPGAITLNWRVVR